MSGNNVLQRFTPDATLQAFEQAVRKAAEEERIDEIEQRAADQRVRQLLREGAL